MKKKIEKMMSLIMVGIAVVIGLFNTMPVVNATSSYDSDKAISYAESHWNIDSSQLCAEFVSNCLKAGGISAWSKSCTALRSQLISSGAGKEYEIALQSDMTIKASNYKDILTKGDVVFFYCPGCVNIDGKPYIHVVLCNGMDSNGYMKAFSHNGANSGKSKYQYSSKCYSCGTKISKAYVYHFNSGFSINFDNTKYNLTTNQQKNISFTFKGDGIATMDYSSSNNSICDA